MVWVKAFHLIAVISWMAALLYLPRLMVYHCRAEIGSVQSETFKIMERRLLRAIATPAMIASWLLGLWLAFGLDVWGQVWFWGKGALVVGLSGFHGAAARWVKAFSRDRNRHGERFYRVANEIPTLLMIGIVILAVVKP